MNSSTMRKLIVGALGDSIPLLTEAIVGELTPKRPANFALEPIEQVAMYVDDIESAMSEYAKLGMGNWVRDTVTGDVTIPDAINPKHAVSVADLAFNYDLGFEFELLHYRSGPNWHYEQGRIKANGHLYGGHEPFMSHMSYHVPDIQEAINRITSVTNLRVIQYMETTNHTNQHLINIGRKFKYAIFNSRHLLGWDIKLIQRVEKEA